MATGDIYTHASVLSTGRWVEIGVTETGINAITPDVIKKAGFTDMSRIRVYGYGGALMPDALDSTYLKAHDDLREIPTCMLNGMKYFYGQGPVSWSTKACDYRTRNPYSTYGGYFITQDDGEARSCTEDSLLQIANSNNAAYHSLYEVDDYAMTEMGANLFDKASLTKGKDDTYTVTVPAAATNAVITVTLASATGGTTYTVSSSITDKQVNGAFGTLGSYSKGMIVSCQLTLDAADLKKADKDADGNYAVPVTVSNANGASSSGTLFLDFISARYDATNVPQSIEGHEFPEAEVIYSITNQNHHADEPKDLIVIIPASQGNLSQAERLCQLHAAKDGISYRIIPADELYSEFSSGTPDVSAFRRYLKMLYDRSQLTVQGSPLSAPRWVLLFGKAYFDNRGLTGSNSQLDLLPVFETDDLYNSNGTIRSSSITTTSSFCSDDYITVLHDGKYANMYGTMGGVPFDIAVGRIPASNDSEAQVYVDKIEHYMDTQYNGRWQRDIMFIGGDGNDSEKKSDPFMHIRQIDENADLVIGRKLGYDVRKVLSPAYTSVTSSTGKTFPQATSEIISQQNQGALIMNYGGHASANQLSNEKLLMLSDMKSFTGTHYSVWITAACETQPYDMSSECLGVAAVKNASGGAIGFIGTSRTVYAGQNTTLNKTLMYHLLTYVDDNTSGLTSHLAPITLGEAMRRTKCCLVSGNGYKPYEDQTDNSYNKHQYNLIGDPALRINLPQDSVIVYSVTTDSDTEDTEDTITVMGLEKVTVKGLICSSDNVARDYSSAKVFLKVYDSCTLDTCREDDMIYAYKKRTKMLFQGVSTFSGDSFETTFRVPAEINSGNDPGQFLIYVIDDNQPSCTAKGEYDKVKFSGSIEPTTEASVPDVYCYLNTKSFVGGDVVGPTPFFVAELNDSDGLFVSESTGHNLELQIDGRADMTYNLNDNFTFDYGSYTTGQTWYVLPALADGRHTARFRVWNLLGTMVTQNLTFVVAGRQSPDFVSVYASSGIVKRGDKVNLYILSDFTGSAATIYLDVFDTAGRLCQTVCYGGLTLGDDLESKNYEDTRSLRQRTTLSWTAGGLTGGLYVYRVRLSCDGYNYVSRNQKMLITN